jgi:hypothetical protein
VLVTGVSSGIGKAVAGQGERHDLEGDGNPFRWLTAEAWRVAERLRV